MEDKAKELIKAFYSKELAIVHCNLILDDLNESLIVTKELHPHAQGIIAGSISIYVSLIEVIKKI